MQVTNSMFSLRQESNLGSRVASLALNLGAINSVVKAKYVGSIHCKGKIIKIKKIYLFLKLEFEFL